MNMNPEYLKAVGNSPDGLFLPRTYRTYFLSAAIFGVIALGGGYFENY